MYHLSNLIEKRKRSVIGTNFSHLELTKNFVYSSSKVHKFVFVYLFLTPRLWTLCKKADAHSTSIC